MKKIIKILLLGFFLNLFSLQLLAQNGNALQGLIGGPIHKLLFAESAIKQVYIDSLSEDKLVENAIVGMLKELDPHSQYTPAKDVGEVTESLEGNFEGIGVQFNMIEDTLVVVQPISNGPSEKVGIMAGDRIIFAGDTCIAGTKKNEHDIKRLLRGPKGSKIKLGIMRPGVSGIHYFTVTRDKIPLYSIDAKYMIDATTGYIHITNFGANTHEEFMSAVHMLKDKGMKDLIIDLQGNGGGYLQAAVNISNEFLDNKDLIVYTSGRSTPKTEYHADGKGILRDGKIVVLVDSYTASASEIVSGAIQDNDRGIIVGRRTYGKGLVQRPIGLPDGSMIRLTTAHYYSPSGRCIQRPYVKGKKTDYDKDLLERLNSGELTNPDSIRFPDSLTYKTLKQQRVVYGGGGIMPDEYVPLDTLQFPKLYRELMAQSIVNRTCMKYLDKNRSKLHRKYKQFDKYLAEFEVPDDMIELLKENASKTELKYSDEEFNQILPVLKVQLKALLARDLWEMNEYYHVINSINNIFNKGVEVIKR
ncbi:MAG: S41 family peptidase [Bacteroidaceae bacterium]|nr:S41 family peptidase [Bacteroidaceae bacterium]